MAEGSRGARLPPRLERSEKPASSASVNPRPQATQAAQGPSSAMRPSASPDPWAGTLTDVHPSAMRPSASPDPWAGTLTNVHPSASASASAAYRHHRTHGSRAAEAQLWAFQSGAAGNPRGRASGAERAEFLVPTQIAAAARQFSLRPSGSLGPSTSTAGNPRACTPKQRAPSMAPPFTIHRSQALKDLLTLGGNSQARSAGLTGAPSIPSSNPVRQQTAQTLARSGPPGPIFVPFGSPAPGPSSERRGPRGTEPRRIPPPGAAIPLGTPPLGPGMSWGSRVSRHTNYDPDAPHRRNYKNQASQSSGGARPGVAHVQEPDFEAAEGLALLSDREAGPESGRGAGPQGGRPAGPSSSTRANPGRRRGAGIPGSRGAGPS